MNEAYLVVKGRKEMSKCDCYQFETKRRYLSNIDKITYTLATERLAPEYIDEEVGVCYGTKEKDVCNCGGDWRVLGNRSDLLC